MGSHTETITAAARLLGIPIHISDDDEWQIHDGVITVGLGFYDTHSPARSLDLFALTAAVLLDLWVGARLPQTARVRTKMRISLGSERPELEPLLMTIDRVQAGGELLTAFPGYWQGLADSMRSRFGRDLREAPESAQFLGALLLTAFAPDSKFRVAPAVRNLITDIGSETLNLALTPLHPADPDRTFKRILAVTLSQFESFLTEQGIGLTTAGLGDDASGVSEDNDFDFGSGSAPSDSEDATESDSVDTDEGDAGEMAEQERARRSGERDTAEGADLFEAEQAADVSAMLDTPMPLTGTSAFNIDDWETKYAPDTSSSDTEEMFSGSRAETRVSLNRYRTRMKRYSGLIEEVREVWRLIVAERATPTRGLSRVPYSEGEILLTTALPGALAEALAGTPRPRAYANRKYFVREREESGNTDFVLLIDRSGSMRTAAPAAADAAMVMIEALAAVSRDIEETEAALRTDLDISFRTALIVFDAEVTVVKPLAAQMNDASRAQLFYETLTTGGGTNDASALDEAARQLGISRGASTYGATPRNRVVIMVSDGGSSDLSAARTALRSLTSRGVTVYGIGIGTDTVATRYAPHGRRVDDPVDIVRVLEELITKGR